MGEDNTSFVLKIAKLTKFRMTDDVLQQSCLSQI